MYPSLADAKALTSITTRIGSNEISFYIMKAQEVSIFPKGKHYEDFIRRPCVHFS